MCALLREADTKDDTNHAITETEPETAENSANILAENARHVITKAELRKGRPVTMYSMVSVNITSQEQLSRKLVVQCRTPLVFIPAVGTGIASLLADTNAGHANNARIVVIWGLRQATFCPVGACVRATRHVAADAVLMLG